MNKFKNTHRTCRQNVFFAGKILLAFLLLNISLTSFAGVKQQRQISGTVVDVQGIPIIGANIIENGTVL